MPVNREAIGTRGELIVANLLTRRHGRDEPLFRPQFLGDKHPTIDFFVELVGTAGTQTPFFLAQVKATAGGYNQRGGLNARVAPAGISGLVKYPAPTYIFGVDEDREVGFIVAAVVGGHAQYRSLPTTHPLADPTTLQDLYDEVRTFWGTHPVSFSRSRFAELPRGVSPWRPNGRGSMRCAPRRSRSST